jgi:prolyl-tRNA synthetase
MIAAPDPQDPSARPAEQVLDTPDTPTIETLVTRLNELGLRDRPFTAADTLKNVVLKTHMPGTGESSLLVVGVPGDRELGAVEIRDGDRCATCGGVLEIARGIEMGHVFALGRKYAETFGLRALDENGKPVTITMGSYGVGVTRAVAAIAEQTYDESGLCWPRSVAPADVHIVATGKDDAVFDTADQIARDLEGAGVEVLYDDRRGVSAGVKFKDAELVGVPTILIIGRGLADGTVEMRDRRSNERKEIPVDEAAATVVATVEAL